MRVESVEEPILSKSMKKVVFVETVPSIWCLKAKWPSPW